MNQAIPLPSLPRKQQDFKADQNRASFDAEPFQKTYKLERIASLNIAISDVIDVSDEDIEFDEVPMEIFDEADSDIEETLEQAVRNINEKTAFSCIISNPKNSKDETIATLTSHPEVVDDYIRNYLSSKGLLKSLEAFQNEWYEAHQKGILAPEDAMFVPDVYLQNQEFAESVSKLRADVENYKSIAAKARATYDKLRKERDFNRMHHKRVVQEKNKLLGDIKKLKLLCDNHEPALKRLQSKYEITLKEKMLLKIEKDRLMLKVGEDPKAIPASITNTEGNAGIEETTSKIKGLAVKLKENTPDAADKCEPVAYDKFKLISRVKAHTLAISGAKFHPKKDMLATVSDDKTWKLWSYPACELIMSGEGHKDWISDCVFHPRGNHLATSSGDGTLKIWDFTKGMATLTLSDHVQPVWSCAFSEEGDILASSSMDNTCKLWDTQRGHVDSVNLVGFKPLSHLLYTCSTDKTISFWDPRTGLCTQTLFGHLNAVNHATFSHQGNTFASCDADGIVKIWDARNYGELLSIDIGPHSSNKLDFDLSGTVLAVASNDGTIKMLNLTDKSKSKDLKVHEEAIQVVQFDRKGECLIAGGNDGYLSVFH